MNHGRNDRKREEKEDLSPPVSMRTFHLLKILYYFPDYAS